MRATLDEVNQAIITFTEDGEVVSLNSAALSMFEHDDQAVIEKVELFVSADDFHRMWPVLFGDFSEPDRV